MADRIIPLTFPPSRRYRVRMALEGDHLHFPARPDFATEHAACGAPLDQGLPAGLGWTLLRNGRPIGMGWVAEKAPGDWACFAYLSDFARSDWAYGAAAARCVFRWIEAAVGARTISVVVRADNPAAERFAERLGFMRTGRCRMATGDYWIMVRGG